MEKNTRLMELMFSEKTPDELKEQVGNDIKAAEKDGVVDTEEVKYEKQDNGDIAITDKENGEVTIASKNPEEADTYDLIAVPDGQLEKFVHPSADGVTPGNAQGAPDEKVDSHMTGEAVIAPNLPDGGLNPEAGHEKSVEETAKEGPQGEEGCPKCGQNPCECEKGEKEFSVTSDNAAWQKIFSMPQEFVDYLFSEVIESCETSKVGDLKVEKCADEDDSVVVTSESTGDQVKVKLEGDNMEVTELDSKSFSNEEQYLPIFVVGVQPYEHIIVEAQEYDMDSAQQLKVQLEEDGVEAVEIFDNPEDTRDYAQSLLEGLNANPAVGTEEEKEFSEHYGCPRFFSLAYETEDTVFMTRMFAEDAQGIAETRDVVEEAINSGKPAELGGATVTPVDAQNAIIQDGGEITKATLQGVDMVLEHIDEQEANAILGNESIIEVESKENEQVNGTAGKEEPVGEGEEEKEFSEDIWTNEAETRFFSESERETMTDYMVRLFSEETDQDAIEEAIAGGKPVETATETITPINGETAVVQDKGNGEYTKVTLIDEDRMNVHPLGDEDAINLLGEGSEEAPTKESENAEAAAEGEQKNYSEIYDWMNEAQTRFFSEGEEMTAYMERLFSEESDQNVIEEAVSEGKQIENDKEIVTPVSATTAVVEDKENGEFTKAVVKNEDEIEVNKISEQEADKLTENLKVEEKAEEEAPEEKAGEEKKEEEKAEEKKEDEGEKEFSENDPIAKFFAQMAAPVVAPAQTPVAQVPVADPAAAAVGVVDPNAQAVPAQAPATAEEIEDKALAAIQSIKACVEEGTAQIMEAKAAPAPNAEPEIQEAQFSEKTFSQNAQNDTLISWLQYK